VDASEPPRIVVESHSSCTDAAQAESLLRDALVRSRAPGHAWAVTMTVEPTAGHTLRGSGAITDENGLEVASRVLSVSSEDCQGLARAVGVWASLVLDEELGRARSQSERAKTSSPPVVEAPTDTLWPAPQPLPEPVPERDLFLQHEDGRSGEAGVGGFLMTNSGVGAVAGASPFVFIETGRGVFVRPSFAVGATTTPPQGSRSSALWMSGRVDTCGRLPGLYSVDRGIQLDLCLGSDVGAAAGTVTIPYVAVGPSIDLRGELGGHLAATLRGVGGLNLTTTGSTSQTVNGLYQPLWSGRLEFALSWSLR
jgi:hypothetical protein